MQVHPWRGRVQLGGCWVVGWGGEVVGWGGEIVAACCGWPAVGDDEQCW